MRRDTFKCFRCSACCAAGLLVPLTKFDFQEWVLSKCYLPVILTVKESNTITESLGLDYVYTLMSHRHSSYKYVRDVLQHYGVKLPERGCALYAQEHSTCRIYRRRPLVCRIFPFTASLTVCDWARDNCEAVRRGHCLPTYDLAKLAELYSREIERTYDSERALREIEELRRSIFDKVVSKMVRDREHLEVLRYYLLSFINFTELNG